MHMYDYLVWIWRATDNDVVKLCNQSFLSLWVAYWVTLIFSGKIITVFASIFQDGGKKCQYGGHFEFNLAHSFFTFLPVIFHRNMLSPSSWYQNAGNWITHVTKTNKTKSNLQKSTLFSLALKNFFMYPLVYLAKTFRSLSSFQRQISF